MCVLVALVAAACSGSDPDTIDWYVSSDNFGARALAESCGGVDVRVHELPRDADEAHSELVRRLAADPESVDLLTVAGSAVPELAAAGFLRKQSADVATGALPAAADQVTYDGDLYAVPWLFDPQLLWFRPVTAERAGIDVTQPVAWTDLIDGAARLGLTVQIADDRNTGLADWVSAMGADEFAAEIVELYRDGGVGPGPSASAVDAFAGPKGGFLIAPGSAWSDPAMAPLGTEIGVAPYPVVDADSVGPAEGIVLAQPQGSSANALIDCLTSDATLAPLIAVSGFAPARTDVPMAETPAAKVLETVLPTVATAPITERWNAIRRALDHTWVMDEVSIDQTPAASRRAVEAAKKGRLP